MVFPGLIWDALQFARNAQIAVGETSLDKFLEGGPDVWATERQMELIGEVLRKLRQVEPDVAGAYSERSQGHWHAKRLDSRLSGRK